MMRAQDLVNAIDQLQADVLDRWIELGWIAPPAGMEGPAFQEVDVARVRLICDLIYDLEIGEEGVPVILSLLDQLHDARRMLRAMAAAIGNLEIALVKRALAAGWAHLLCAAQHGIGGRTRDHEASHQ